jgi:hypothetical protein
MQRAAPTCARGSAPALGKWRKLKGFAVVRLRSGRERRAELHWYEAHGIGRRDMKRKRYIDDYEHD